MKKKHCPYIWMLIVLLFSCSTFNKPNNDNISNTNIELNSGADDNEKYLIYIINHIEGYYNVQASSNYSTGEHSNYIAFISINDNKLLINNFNIINNEVIYKEMYSFDLNTYDPKNIVFIMVTIGLEYHLITKTNLVIYS